MIAILDIANLIVIVVGADGPDENEYGYREKLKTWTNEELVEKINREVGIPHWVRRRGDYLAHLYLEFISRDLDCTSFIHENLMSIAKPLRLEGNKILI